MDIILGILEIIGSLGLFLFGMRIMGDGLQNCAGDRLQGVLGHMTSNRFAALLTGLGITAIIQSSSATTVFVVSFVNAELLSLQQAIGVIMGANIGTTVTAWIVSIFGFKVDIAHMAIPAIAVGLPFFFMKNTTRKALGETFIGFGLLFLGLMYLKDSVPDLKNNPQVQSAIAGFANLGFISYISFVAVGTIVTIVVQSSSAAMAITLTMANAGWIDFTSAAALCLGENIGTTITAQLAAIGQNRVSRQAAVAHTLFNVIGVLWMLLLFALPGNLFIRLVDFLVPGDPAIPANIPTHISMFHTLFNVLNSLLFLGFVPQFARFIEKIIPSVPDAGSNYKLPYKKSSLQDTPELNVLTAKTELVKMARKVCEMFSLSHSLYKDQQKIKKERLAEVYEIEDYVDQMQEEISAYVASCMQEKLSDNSSRNLGHMLKIIDELETIADNITAMTRLLERILDKKQYFSPEQFNDIAPFLDEVNSFLEFIHKKLNKPLSAEDLSFALDKETRIDQFRNNLKKNARKRIQQGANVKREIQYIDALEQLELIGDLLLDIAKELKDFA